jgi:hypothetical protein
LGVGEGFFSFNVMVRDLGASFPTSITWCMSPFRSTMLERDPKWKTSAVVEVDDGVEDDGHRAILDRRRTSYLVCELLVFGTDDAL